MLDKVMNDTLIIRMSKVNGVSIEDDAIIEHQSVNESSPDSALTVILWVPLSHAGNTITLQARLTSGSGVEFTRMRSLQGQVQLFLNVFTFVGFSIIAF